MKQKLHPSVLMLGKGSERLQTAADGDEITVIVRTTHSMLKGRSIR